MTPPIGKDVRPLTHLRVTSDSARAAWRTP